MLAVLDAYHIDDSHEYLDYLPQDRQVLRFPTTLEVLATTDGTRLDFRLDLSPFRRADRATLYPRPQTEDLTDIAASHERAVAHVAADRLWRKSAARRGEIAYFAFPHILRKLTTDFLRVALGRRNREGYGIARTPGSTYAPDGPWHSVPVSATDYFVRAWSDFPMVGARLPLIQVVEAVFADLWILTPVVATIEYLPERAASDGSHAVTKS